MAFREMTEEDQMLALECIQSSMRGIVNCGAEEVFSDLLHNQFTIVRVTAD